MHQMKPSSGSLSVFFLRLVPPRAGPVCQPQRSTNYSLIRASAPCMPCSSTVPRPLCHLFPARHTCFLTGPMRDVLLIRLPAAWPSSCRTSRLPPPSSFTILCTPETDLLQYQLPFEPRQKGALALSAGRRGGTGAACCPARCPARCPAALREGCTAGSSVQIAPSCPARCNPAGHLGRRRSPALPDRSAGPPDDGAGSHPLLAGSGGRIRGVCIVRGARGGHRRARALRGRSGFGGEGGTGAASACGAPDRLQRLLCSRCAHQPPQERLPQQLHWLP